MTKKQLTLLFLLPLLLRILPLFFFNPPIVSDSAEYVAIAKSVVAGSGYALDGIPTAYRAPGYPLFISGLFLLKESILLVRFAQAILGALSCVLLYVLGGRLFDKRVGAVAWLLWTCMPVSIFQPLLLMSETMFTTLLLLALVCSLSERNKTPLTMVLTGCLWGVAALVKQHVLFIIPLYYLVILRHRYGWGSGARHAGLLCAGAVIILLPWVLRNKIEMGEFMLGTNIGEIILIGHNPQATGTYRLPDDNPYMQYSETVANRESIRRAIEYALHNPLNELKLCVKKVAFLYSSHYSTVLGVCEKESATVKSFIATYRASPLWLHLLINIPYAFLLLCGIYGFVKLTGRNRTMLFLATIVAAWGLLFTVLFSGQARYNYPMLVLFTLAAAAGVAYDNKQSIIRIGKRGKVITGTAWLFLLAVWGAEIYMVLRT